jgi:hypothetical protein
MKLHFKPETFWNTIVNDWIAVDALSGILHGTPSSKYKIKRRELMHFLFLFFFDFNSSLVYLLE